MKITSGQAPPQPTAAMQTTKAVRAASAQDLQKMRLRKAAKEMESFFILHMLQAMRRTIPKSDFSGGGLGEDVYNSLFDEELSKLAAGNSGSLSEMLYRSLEEYAVTQDSTGTTTAGVSQARTVTAETSETPVIESSQPSTTEERTVGTAVASTATLPKASPPKIASDAVLKDYGSAIEEASRQYAVDAKLIYSVIMAESGGNPAAVSSQGAKGLMQLMDATAADMGVADSLNPQQNIIGGTKYLRRLLDKYDGDVKLTLAAYNAGPGAVEKHNGVPPYAETRQYVDKVINHLHRIQKR